ncbi:S1 family peptidase [Pseudarthrobacter sp. NBSH8]|uniref:S1 family peptidase n=1 Tax=Pseudarthrobacter sp. NBSH8 TaxID=2596911 RepID=UPI00162AD162|nr:S1 family peptidase [Pseudarthrobacter sp. NBSH8]QNE15686.1 LPXTG cell wall anchor domain-containing protein [Pseudarthrobacter sp. NBSH8]
MSLAEFNAAGELGRRAADAADSLRALPGYLGIRLQAGEIMVEGAGSALQARVDELNQPGLADFVLVSPPTSVAATPVPETAATPPVPTAVPSVPAIAEPELVAGSIDQLFQAYVRDVGTKGLQAVAYTDGHFVIRTGSVNTPESEVPTTHDSQPAAGASAPASAEPGKLTPAQFVARYANVQLEKGAAVKTEDDIFGGQGYFADNQAICSAGFSAFSPAGLPLVLTAGHCAADGLAKAAGIEPLSSAPAGGSTTPLTGPLASLGSFGFSQFGGPNNSTAASDGSSVGTDIAVIQAITPGLSLQPAATTWGNAGTPDPVKIIGTTAPFQGQDVCRSGRTSGWKCGTVDAVGIWMMPGPKSAPPNYDNDLRAVRAFDSTSVKSAGGDSGGPWISGNFAVGTHTGAEILNGTQTLAIAATLEDSIATIPGGVQVQLFLNKPELVAPANLTFAAGADVTGRVGAAPASTVAANSKVLITVAGQQPLEVPVDAAGNWSFTAPEAPGTFTFAAETVNGFSRSGAAALTAIVAPSSLSTPTITTPAAAPLPELKSLAGTGAPGATVSLTGDVTGSAFVGPEGRWSVPLTGPAVFGRVNVTAVLSYTGIADSPPATGTFTVTPPAPIISSISDGLHLRQDALPESISGSGVNGAEVTVSIDGIPLSGATAGGKTGSRSVARTVAPLLLVVDGAWSVPFPAGLALGTHTLSVTEAVDGIASAPAVATFVIDAPAPVVIPAAAGPAEVPAANGAVPPAADSAAVVRPLGDSRAASLANTGASGLVLFAGLAAGALAVGGVFLVLVKRRKRQRPTRS